MLNKPACNGFHPQSQRPKAKTLPIECMALYRVHCPPGNLILSASAMGIATVVNKLPNADWRSKPWSSALDPHESRIHDVLTE